MTSLRWLARDAMRSLGFRLVRPRMAWFAVVCLAAGVAEVALTALFWSSPAARHVVGSLALGYLGAGTAFFLVHLRRRSRRQPPRREE